jgi:FtsH-binding integral membrane protein
MKNNTNQSYIPVAEPANQQQYNNMENGGGYGQQQYKQGKPGNQQYSQLNDFQQQQSMYLAEAEKSVRMGFVRKVYGILMIQLLVTVGVSTLFIVNEDCRQLVRNSPEILWAGYGVMFVTLIVLTCCGEFRRKHPHGLIGLGIFTLATSFFVGVISSIYAQVIGEWIVIEALIMTVLIVAGLTAFAFQTKYDFTRFNGFLVAIVMWITMMLMFNFVFIFPNNRIWYTIYASCGAAFMCFFIVHDTQLMIGGKHKYQLNIDEHVFAALNLYLDIINLFLYILSILSSGRR